MVTVWPTLKPCGAVVVTVQFVPDSVMPLVAATVETPCTTIAGTFSPASDPPKVM